MKGLECGNVKIGLEAITRLLVSVPDAYVKHKNGQIYLDLITERMGDDYDKQDTRTCKINST